MPHQSKQSSNRNHKSERISNPHLGISSKRRFRKRDLAQSLHAVECYGEAVKRAIYAPSIAVLHECPRVGNLVAQLGAKDKENKKGAAVALRLMMMMMPKMASVAEE